MKGNLAIIPARGGSKRILKKNIKSFLGKPVLAYAIEVALASGLFDDVMVSTDDKEIEAVAKEYGASIPFIRSDQNADDHATTSAVLNEVLEEYHQRGKSFSYACCIYPCAPFISKDILRAAYTKMQNEKFDCVLPVVPYGNSIWRSLHLNNIGTVKMNWPENASKRSQDMPAAYFDAGQFYFFDVSHFMKNKDLWAGNIGAVVISELEAQDIDTITDWKLAELKYKLLNTR